MIINVLAPRIVANLPQTMSSGTGAMRISDSLYYSVQPTLEKQKFKPVRTFGEGVATEQVWGDTKSDKMARLGDCHIPGTTIFLRGLLHLSVIHEAYYCSWTGSLWYDSFHLIT